MVKAVSPSITQPYPASPRDDPSRTPAGAATAFVHHQGARCRWRIEHEADKTERLARQAATRSRKRHVTRVPSRPATPAHHMTAVRPPVLPKGYDDPDMDGQLKAANPARRAAAEMPDGMPARGDGPATSASRRGAGSGQVATMYLSSARLLFAAVLHVVVGHGRGRPMGERRPDGTGRTGQREGEALGAFLASSSGRPVRRRIKRRPRRFSLSTPPSMLPSPLSSTSLSLPLSSLDLSLCSPCSVLSSAPLSPSLSVSPLSRFSGPFALCLCTLPAPFPYSRSVRGPATACAIRKAEQP
ncbi:hypothetical protein CDD83_2829 [Cordyceps sp. RAO-2017]|nr:hypothetical protein CDD83_2829 [Cordyceps sp. RAO-2017]